MANRRVILVVRDGWGYSEEEEGNAVCLAETPNNDRYQVEYPWTLLECTGKAVGIPEGTQGGSEPGHLIMGAGRVVRQPYEEINRSIREGTFYRNEALLNAIKYCQNNCSKLHLMGLLSDQGIHGTVKHLYALLELCRLYGFNRVYIHCFLDGRDVPERSSKHFLKETERVISKKNVGTISSIIGRYYAMDRDNNWERTLVAYNLLTLGNGKRETNIYNAIDQSYITRADTDYYIGPITIVNKKEDPLATIEEGDAVIFWNFRSDRARQLTYAFTGNAPNNFNPKKTPSLHFVCMSVYDQELNIPVAFPQHKVQNNLAQVLRKNGLKQLRIAETEKYAHVTFFFNSQVEKPVTGEDRILIPSSKVLSYEEKPEMSAFEINQQLVPLILSGFYDFILVNYANGDLVGHSANLSAGIKACEIVDACIGELVNAALKTGYVILITGDHGNVETMLYPNGEPNTSHGMNPVPFILVSKEQLLKRVKLKNNLGLSSVAPTILTLMGLDIPAEMTGENIIKNIF